VRFAHAEWLHLLWLAAPIAILFLVRRRPKVAEVSSLILWRSVLAEDMRHPWLGALREPFMLLLNLLLLALIALAAAGPERVEAGPGPKTWAVVIDGGVTMEARAGDGRTRFDTARDRVREILARVALIDRVILVLAGPTPVLLAPPGPPGPRLAAALAEASPGAGPSDLDAAITLAGSAAGEEPDLLVVVGETAPDGPATGFVSVAEPTVNVGFTGVSARRDPVTLGTRITFTVGNAGPDAAEREVTILGPGGRRETVRISLTPGEKTERTVDFEPAAAGQAELTLAPGDAFTRDDRIVVPVSPPPRMRVLSTGVLDPFLEAALRAQGDRVDRAGSAVLPADDLPETIPSNAVLILDGQDAPAGLVRGNVWVFGAPGAASRKAPAVTSSVSDHPVMAGVDLSHFGLTRARPLRDVGGRRVLVRAEGGPVITAEARDGLRILRFGFALKDGNLHVLAAFPVLVRNALAWFSEEEARLFPAAIRAGEPLESERRLPDGLGSIYLSGPALTTPVEVHVRHGRLSHRPHLTAAGEGMMVVRAGTRREHVAVNAVWPDVNALPGDPGTVSAGDLPDRAGVRAPDPDLTPYVLLALGLLLLFEWWIFQRGRARSF
jgi:Aerotolerance regulator N-terminal/von Willebrand factor type A domain